LARPKPLQNSFDKILAKADPTHYQYSQSLVDTEMEAPAAQVVKQKVQVPSHSKMESELVDDDNVRITRATRSTTVRTQKHAVSPSIVISAKRSRTTVSGQPVKKDIQDYFIRG
jgi:hypothetical protein